MDIGGKYYEPPRVWPGLGELNGQLSVTEGYPFPYLAKSEGYLLGLFFGLDRTGVIQIGNLLKTNKDLKCKLIIGIYPACASGCRELEEVQEIQNEFTDRVDFRLYIINSINSGVSSSLLFIDKASNNSILATGPFLGFNSRPIDPSLASFVFHPETALLKSWTDWFDYTWIKHSIPLNFITTQIPNLVPVEASEKVVTMWDSYLKRCLQSCEYGAKSEIVAIEIKKETGEIAALDQSGKEVLPPTKELGISQISPLIERISRLYSSGKLVSFNKLTRVPPLDCPARAEWFGEESLHIEGTVTKETRYRISALDNEELKKINNLKSNGNSLLRRLGFTLGDNLHWMSDAMIILLKKELDRISKDALQIIHNSMGIKKGEGEQQSLFPISNAKEENARASKETSEITKAFITERLNRIISDANHIYKEFHKGGNLEHKAIDAITSELQSRLEKVLAGNLIPGIVQNMISFSPSLNEDKTALFDQPLLLLDNLAVFTRKVLSEDRFYLQGIKIDFRDLLDAVDVCGDQIILASKCGSVRRRALFELSLLEEIMQSEVNSEVKCSAIFAIFDGVSDEKIHKMIKK